jgi:hypothetical protein
MTSETDYEGSGVASIPDEVPDDAPEADVLEQRQSSRAVVARPEDDGVPIEADPADVDDQRREVPEGDEDDYR